MSVYIIAEAGVNHNGDMETAKRLVDAAVEAGGRMLLSFRCLRRISWRQ